MKVLVSGGVSGKGNKKLVKDGRSGLKHPSGWSRAPIRGVRGWERAVQ